KVISTCACLPAARGYIQKLLSKTIQTNLFWTTGLSTVLGTDCIRTITIKTKILNNSFTPYRGSQSQSLRPKVVSLATTNV
ncbi:MAG: hypothetical protein NWR71_03680, partial [Paracoccaceae bacterium]|nr:hypothetical protein [Paracoccaceae bacterium]MDP5351306.1 hypothetical protein [Paracoccaceae bacterium]